MGGARLQGESKLPELVILEFEQFLVVINALLGWWWVAELG